MSVYSPLSPISAALATALNVSALTTVATGAYDTVPQATVFPFVLYEVSEEDQSAFGSRPGSGRGSGSRVRVRCHIFSQHRGMKECQTILAVLKSLLATPLTATGYSCWSSFFQSAIPVGDEVVAGVPCKELVADWLMDVEES